MTEKNKLECVGGMLDGEFRKDIGKRISVEDMQKIVDANDKLVKGMKDAKD